MELRGLERRALTGTLLVAAFVVGWLIVSWVLGSRTGRVSDGSTIDGWKLGGPVIGCTDADPQRPCSALLPLARARLDQRDPGHAAVVASELRTQDDISVIRTSVMYVGVFTLADGSHRAIGVLYPGVSTTPMTFDYGP